MLSEKNNPVVTRVFSLKEATLTFLFLVVSWGAFGQQVDITSKGIATDVDEREAIRAVKQSGEDSIAQSGNTKVIQIKRWYAKKDTVASALDSIKRIKEFEKFTGRIDTLNALKAGAGLHDVKKIYSERYLQKVADSLFGEGNGTIIRKIISDPESFSDPQLLAALSKRFPVLDQTSKYRNSSLPPVSDNLTNVRDSLSDLYLAEMPTLQMKDSLLSELPPLPGGQLKTKYLEAAGDFDAAKRMMAGKKEKYLSVLDSLRDVNLKEEGMELMEEQVSENTKVATIREKLTFKDRTYFEGILGIMSGWPDKKMTILQVSPSLGYRFASTWSVGAGPNAMLQVEDGKLNVQAGLRTFVKREFFQQRAYLQVEDMVNMPQRSTTIENVKTAVQHNLLVGGGYLLPLTSKLSLNFSLLYTVAGNGSTAGNAVPATSPWVIRVGLSSVKRKK